MRIVFALALISSSFAAKAQWNTEWYTGVIVLNSSEVITGTLAIKDDAVLVKKGLRVEVVPAHRLVAVRYYDALANINRKFVVHSDTSGYHRSFEILEVVVTGKLSVLRKPRGEVKADPGRREAAFYYFIKTNNGLESFRHFSRSRLPELKASVQSLDHYIKKSKIRVNDKAGIIKFVTYYNGCSLAESSASVDGPRSGDGASVD